MSRNQSSGITLHKITPQLASNYKAVRLRALKDTPTAFGSTYARESQFSDEDWRQRSLNLCTPHSIGYLVSNNNDYCGIAAAFLNEQNPLEADIVSVWVAPEHRKFGVGRLLMDAIQSWALRTGVHTLLLMVTSSNYAAIDFYQRIGFTMTGHTEPYPNDPALIEHQMSKAIVLN
jgi:ribosomal protein S18 acetylase RimI-like enzyme